MANRQYIQDLNSLIRLNSRNRLKSPPLRSAINGGRGQSEVGDTEVTDTAQNMYIAHNSPSGAYEYLNDGAAPTRFGDLGANGGLGIFGADVFSSSASNGVVYKNGAYLFETGTGFARVAANSTRLVVEDGSYNVQLWNNDGTFDRAFALPKDFADSGAPHFANDVGVGYKYASMNPAYSSYFAISDYNGVLIANELIHDIAFSDMGAASKHCFLFVDNDWPAREYRLKIFNNAGTLLATHVIDRTATDTALNSDQLDGVGITETEIYLIGRNTSSAPNVLIYEHNLTIDGTGLATAAVLGPLLATVATPGVSSSTLRVQYGVINAELMA